MADLEVTSSGPSPRSTPGRRRRGSGDADTAARSPGGLHRGLLRRAGAQRTGPGLRRCASSPSSTRRPGRSISRAPSRATPWRCTSCRSSRPGPVAASTTVPLFGALTGTHLTALLQDPLPEVVWLWELDAAARTCRFSARRGSFVMDLPMDPMHGTVGVAPANLEVRSALVPDAFGGNMDTPRCAPGSPATWASTWPGRCSPSATGTPARARARPAGSRSSAR